MPIERFWKNLSLAKKEVDSIDSMIRDLRPGQRTAIFYLDLWLTPQTVEGYDPKDFWFLPPDRQERLKNAVERFEQTVRPLTHASRPPNDSEMTRAREELDAILAILQPDLYRDAREFQVDQVLKLCLNRLRGLGHPISRILHRIEEDSTGEEALWIWVIVEDQLAESPSFFESAEQIRSELIRMLRAFGIDFWPFVHFRTASEQAEEDGETS